MVDSKRHTVGLAKRPHMGEGGRCVRIAVVLQDTPILVLNKSSPGSLLAIKSSESTTSSGLFL